MRVIRSPDGSNTISNVLPEKQGGTGLTTASAVAAAMDAINKAELGSVNGLAKSDNDLKIPAVNIPIDKLSIVSIEGPKKIAKGTSDNLFIITNYDKFTTYKVSSNTGTVKIIEDKIYYNAKDTIGDDSFFINGRTISFTVGENFPLKPLLAVSDIAGNLVRFNLTTDVFKLTGGSGTHVSTDWQISLSDTFDTIVTQSLNDSVNKTEYTFGSLNLNTVYYVRVRHRSSLGEVSEWSVVRKPTKAVYIPIEKAKITHNDPLNGDSLGFGLSVSADGSRIAAGTHSKTGPAGVHQGFVYIFKRTGDIWTQEAKLAASDPVTQDRFGYSLSLSGDGLKLAVGVFNKTGPAGTKQGAAYIFTRSGTTWSQEAKLLASDPAQDDYFGQVVSMDYSGSFVLCGAPGKSVSVGDQKGAVYVFIRAGASWSQQAKLIPSDPIVFDRFGYSLNINNTGDVCVISSNTKTGPAGANQGAIYVFTRSGSTWTQEAKLLASDAAGSDRFGITVAISGDSKRIVASTYLKINSNGTQGAVYVFVKTVGTWAQEAKLLFENGDSTCQFGCSLDISDDGLKIIVGANFKTITNTNQGCTVTYIRNGSTWYQEGLQIHSDPVNNDQLGSLSCISGDGLYCVNSAYNKSVSIEGQGAVYVFQ